MNSLAVLFKYFSPKINSSTYSTLLSRFSVQRQHRGLSSVTTILHTNKTKSVRSAFGTSNNANVGNETETDFKSLSADEWSKRLTPEQVYICRDKGTEPPFTGKYYAHSEPGVYTCSCCGASLFGSESKYDSGSGWPSFSSVINGSVIEQPDWSMGVNRTEILCSRCNAHLGHVFPDGPQPTGMRYCVNSVCLNFIPKPET